MAEYPSNLFAELTDELASAAPVNAHEHHSNSKWLNRVLIGGGVLAAGVILAPHLLPSLGIGTLEYAKVASICTSAPEATGLAGLASRALSHVPLIGETLAAGGIGTSIATGVIGLGGALLSHYIAKREDGSTQIRWSNVIKTAALLTSALVALPAILPALGMGVMYLGTMALGIGAADGFIAGVMGTLGTVAAGSASMQGGLGVGALMVPHLLTCGLALGSASLAIGSNTHKHAEKPSFSDRLAAERQTAPQLMRA